MSNSCVFTMRTSVPADSSGPEGKEQGELTPHCSCSKNPETGNLSILEI
jgi:hypothetical protein